MTDRIIAPGFMAKSAWGHGFKIEKSDSTQHLKTKELE